MTKANGGASDPAAAAYLPRNEAERHEDRQGRVTECGRVFLAQIVKAVPRPQGSRSAGLTASKLFDPAAGGKWAATRRVRVTGADGEVEEDTTYISKRDGSVEWAFETTQAARYLRVEAPMPDETYRSWFERRRDFALRGRVEGDARVSERASVQARREREQREARRARLADLAVSSGLTTERLAGIARDQSVDPWERRRCLHMTRVPPEARYGVLEEARVRQRDSGRGRGWDEWDGDCWASHVQEAVEAYLHGLPWHESVVEFDPRETTRLTWTGDANPAPSRDDHGIGSSAWQRAMAAGRS